MFKLVLALLCALLVAVFAVQNATPVVVGFLHWRFDLSLALVILGSTALGAVFVFLLGLVQQMSRGMKLRECRNRVRQLEGELEDLKEKLEAGALDSEKFAGVQSEGGDSAAEVVEGGGEGQPPLGGWG